MVSLGISASYQSIDAVITEQLANNTQQKNSQGTSSFSIGNDNVSVGMDDLYKSLTVLGDKIITQLDELLAEELPDGIASLNPEEHTPDATADRIADGAIALFSAYARQNPDMDEEELITSFMETVKGGIEQGYNEAMAILGDLGAFQFDGIEAGIEQTMGLVEEKLLAFEKQYREEHGLSTDESESTTSTEQSNVASQEV